MRAVRLAEKHHIAVVIGTPTDAPPAWLTAAHPETLRVDAEGRPAEHGSRRQFNYASPEYRKFCAAIAEQLARRFGHDPDVIGWQIGNEYTDESFDPATRRQFQAWLKRRYGTLDALNRAWVTAYWSQTYDRWEEISLPTAGGNPGPAARTSPLCQRYLARLPAGADRRHSQVRRSAPVHHHKHRRAGLERQLGPL